MKALKTSFISILYGDDRTGFVRYDRRYFGFRNKDNTPLVFYVFDDEYAEILTPEKSLKVHEFTSEGFEWGYLGGAGPKQLALALLLEHYPEEVAQKHAFVFNNVITSTFGTDKWSLKEKEIREFVEQEEEEGGGI